MALNPGTRLGPYEVTTQIGAGGMGEVYRATDGNLKRSVAIKVLPASVAGDADRLARFQREAEVLAALNHPNIGAIYGLEKTPDVTALVMELVEGDDLSSRIARGAVPIDEALPIARQIADALEAAHEQGIIHRDLKPANIKIRADGTVKVLDFGLAKAMDPAGASRVDAINSPTVTAHATQMGMILGTAAYMAPEQAKGRSVDTRADIWAFGVVFYEMVTGERPFRGESLQETLAAVLTADPQWARVPPPVRPLLRACLERDPLKRLRDIADYRFLLAPPEAPARIRRSPARSLLIAAAALTAVVLAFVAGKSLTRDAGASAPEAPIRLSTMLPAGVSVTRGPGYTSSVAVSPDGRTIIIAASDKDGKRLYRRSLDRLDPTPLAGTDRGSSPFFSWDGKWIGFFADGRLKRIPAAGGASLDVAPAPGFPSGASWGPDDRIVFAYGADSHLQVVPAEGGRVERLTNEALGRQPEVLPDGQTVLFEAAGHIHAYDRQKGAITKLLAGTAPRYANGHVIFSRGTTLLAAPFNIKDSSTGAAIPVADGVAVELPGSGGGRHYAISRSGALVYVPAADAYELVVVGANAVERVVGQPQRSLENPRFSPDGRYLVVASRRRDDEATDLWLHDLHAGTATRLTSDGGRAPIWSDHGTSITYSHLGEQQGIYTTRVDGGGERRRVLALNAFHWLVGWTPTAPHFSMAG